MSQSIAEELARVPMSPNLMATLTRAADCARQQGHGRVTLEHVLLALTEDSDAALVLQASQVATEPLTADVSTHLTSLEPTGGDGQIAISPELKRVLEAAAAAAQQGRRQVNGAIVLAAIVGEGKSTAAQMLRAQGLTFEHAIKALQRSSRPQPAKGAPRAAPATPAGTNAPPPMPPDVPKAPPESRTGPPPLAPASVAPDTPAPAAARQEPDAPQRAAPPSVEATAGEWGPADQEQPAEPSAPTVPPPRPVPPVLPATPRTAAPGPSPVHVAPSPPQPAPSAPISAPRPTEPSWQPASLPREEPSTAPPARHDQRTRPPEPTPDFYDRSPEPAYDPEDQAPAYGQQQFPAPAEAPYMPQQGYEHGPNGYPAPADVPWQPPDQAYGVPQQPAPYPSSQGYPAPAAPTGYGHGPDPHRGPALPALADAHRDWPQAASGQLIENIPRTIRVDVPVTVEVRLVGTNEAARDHVSQATRAMSVRLSASDGGYTVESLTPETQWIEGGSLPEGQAVARWRWMVVPQRSGRRNLQLAVSTRWVGADGISGDLPMPAQQVTVSVRRRYAKGLGRILGWLVAAGLGAAAVLYGGGVWAMLLALAKPWIGD